jgi:hypothetical protein
MVAVAGIGVIVGVTGGGLGVAVTTITFCPGMVQAIATKIRARAGTSN